MPVTEAQLFTLLDVVVSQSAFSHSADGFCCSQMAHAAKIAKIDKDEKCGGVTGTAQALDTAIHEYLSAAAGSSTKLGVCGSVQQSDKVAGHNALTRALWWRVSAGMGVVTETANRSFHFRHVSVDDVQHHDAKAMASATSSCASSCASSSSSSRPFAASSSPSAENERERLEFERVLDTIMAGLPRLLESVLAGNPAECIGAVVLARGKNYHVLIFRYHPYAAHCAWSQDAVDHWTRVAPINAPHSHIDLSLSPSGIDLRFF
jgi:hypothetical protein